MSYQRVTKFSLYIFPFCNISIDCCQVFHDEVNDIEHGLYFLFNQLDLFCKLHCEHIRMYTKCFFCSCYSVIILPLWHDIMPIIFSTNDIKEQIILFEILSNLKINLRTRNYVDFSKFRLILKVLIKLSKNTTRNTLL